MIHDRVKNLDLAGKYFGPIAVLASISLSPDDIERRTGVHFETFEEDVGPSSLAAFRTESGTLAGMRFQPEVDNYPVELFVNEEAKHPEGWHSLAEELLKELGLADDPHVQIEDYWES